MTPETRREVDAPPPEISFVIPVYNSAVMLEQVVAEIRSACSDHNIEIVLVNDGSADDSDAVCRRLVEASSTAVIYVELARNFGEYNAVLAGLQFATGNYAVVMDDDGQNPASEALRLYDEIRRSGCDVVFGRYAVRHHSGWRNLASRLHNSIAGRVLRVPPGFYLSSFKVMNRFLVEALRSYQNPPPYIDALICRTTRNIGQLEVTHRARLAGESTYDLRRLLSLSLGTLVSFSILPLRAAGVLGLICSFLSGVLLLFMIIDKLWIKPEVPMGIATVVCTIAFFSGVQLLILGVVGEYLGRLFLARPGIPPFIVRHSNRIGRGG